MCLSIDKISLEIKRMVERSILLENSHNCWVRKGNILYNNIIYKIKGTKMLAFFLHYSEWLLACPFHGLEDYVHPNDTVESRATCTFSKKKGHTDGNSFD